MCSIAGYFGGRAGFTAVLSCGCAPACRNPKGVRLVLPFQCASTPCYLVLRPFSVHKPISLGVFRTPCYLVLRPFSVHRPVILGIFRTDDLVLRIESQFVLLSPCLHRRVCAAVHQCLLGHPWVLAPALLCPACRSASAVDLAPCIYTYAHPRPPNTQQTKKRVCAYTQRGGRIHAATSHTLAPIPAAASGGLQRQLCPDSSIRRRVVGACPPRRRAGRLARRTAHRPTGAVSAVSLVIYYTLKNG